MKDIVVSVMPGSRKLRDVSGLIDTPWHATAWPIVQECDGKRANVLITSIRFVVPETREVIASYVRKLALFGLIRLVRLKKREPAPPRADTEARAVLHIVCDVCGEPRRANSCRSCVHEVPRSDDRRWPLWVAHLAAHPELRPRAATDNEMRSPLVAGQWSITKVINVDAWAENAAAPFPTIDEMAMRSSGDGSPSLAAHTRNRIT